DLAPLRELIDEARREIRRWIWIRQPAVDRRDVAHRDVFVAQAGAIAAVRDLGLAQRDLAADRTDLTDEALVERGADARRAPARVHRVDVLAARREVIAHLLACARQPDLVRALGDPEALRRLIVGQLEHVADHERGALAGRQAVDDRGHAALLE